MSTFRDRKNVASDPVSPPPLKRVKIDAPNTETALMPSPFRLTHVPDLPESNNEQTVRLSDVLGNPLIRECWIFDFLFDVDFIMSQFDQDIRSQVLVKVIHGSWRKEDANRQRIEAAAARHPNVQVITAYMPEAFGCHHAKIVVNIQHDDLAQIFVHTANMIARDWQMCQAIWQSPLLPLQSETKDDCSSTASAIGTGRRFKHDFIRYLNSYGRNRTGNLISQLEKFNFSTIKAAFVASVPTKTSPSTSNDTCHTLWGWPGLQQVLGQISSATDHGDKANVVVQVSSIASVGQKWLDAFFGVLATSKDNGKTKPKFNIMFPTADEIRRSITGYETGGSIHMKLQSTTQQKQLAHIRPLLVCWDGNAENEAYQEGFVHEMHQAGRNRAAPHIKTFMRFSSDKMDRLDWAMLTSANLSTQAWGAMPSNDDQVRICSYEAGVVVWPELYNSSGSNESRDEKDCVFVPTFKTDIPVVSQISAPGINQKHSGITPNVVVGIRMPYDLPLCPYPKDVFPWCATASHSEPDCKGLRWSI